MKVKGKQVIENEESLEFAKSMRGQYIISQALYIASHRLECYEVDGDRRAEPSNRKDMEYLLKAFPLYKLVAHDTSIWQNLANNKQEEE